MSTNLSPSIHYNIESIVSSSCNSRIRMQIYDVLCFVVVAKVSEELSASFYYTYK